MVNVIASDRCTDRARACLQVPLLTGRLERMAWERVLGIILSWGGANPLAAEHRETHFEHPVCPAVQGMLQPDVATPFCGAVLDGTWRGAPPAAAGRVPPFRHVPQCNHSAGSVFLHKCICQR